VEFRTSAQAAGAGQLAFMVFIFAVGTVARWLGIDKEVVAYGITIADMIHMLHAANLLVNGFFAVKHLITAHEPDHE
jgi:hypothetical protein